MDILAWVSANQALVGSSIALLAVLGAIGASYIQGWLGLKGIRDQIREAALREQQSEVRLGDALRRCLVFDVTILRDRLAAVRMDLEDFQARDVALAGNLPRLTLPVPDTVAASWQDLARLDPEVVVPVRRLFLELSELAELDRAASASPAAAQEACHQALMVLQRAAATIETVEARIPQLTDQRLAALPSAATALVGDGRPAH